MNRPSEELLHKTLENRATAAEAASVAEWLATDSGQAWASRYIGRDFDRQESCGDYEREEVASERIFARIKTALTRSRRRRILFRVAAVVIPVALVLGVALRLDRQVGGIFSDAEYGEFVVDRGRRTQCLFQDGTVAHLNSESKIHYPVKFGLFERRIQLEGEAYFEVARNTSHPFVVDMNRMEIEVLGTTFDARYERASGIAETTLNSGSICVRTSRSQQSVRLRPDERLVFNETSGSMIIEQVNASNYNSWIQPTLTFFDMTLEDIITNLERWFNVPIGTDASVDRTIRLSFHVRHESLEETLQVISLITGLQYTLDGESATFHTARTTRSR